MGFRPLIQRYSIFDDGIAFSLRWILRLAIVLLGLQISVSQISLIGMKGATVVIAATIATFYFTIWFGNFLNVDPALTRLLATGTSICGASAIVAANAVVRAKEEDVVYALASVTAFGSIFMIVYPWLADLMRLSPHNFGLWAGSSVHEVAQVVAATFSSSSEAGEFGTISKLGRVLLLAPMVLVLDAMYRHDRKRKQVLGSSAALVSKLPVVPWFVVGFAIMIVVGNIGFDGRPLPYISAVTLAMLTTSLAALGLKTDVQKLRTKGLRAALVGAGASAFISLLSLALIVAID